MLAHNCRLSLELISDRHIDCVNTEWLQNISDMKIRENNFKNPPVPLLDPSLQGTRPCITD